ncbi:hypothetical protein GCM10010211_57100 [Streptomyces albospinus]|uniref:Uncharacterized protein n=1 Tax=Streptomyces albospinus TaxID=285515 RepID=A0ABQ2VHQ2_9ACTN|nr:hypothetical protein [Streptomyces albospinus]GGU83735.1 hypothetical protein GCM10010211_57100 [Streptomyces albospinus]
MHEQPPAEPPPPPDPHRVAKVAMRVLAAVFVASAVAAVLVVTWVLRG